MTTLAPAKINLSLKITRKREDGFHELETLVLPLPSLADELTFESANSYSLHCDTPGVPTDETNLVSRALRLFEKNTSQACPFRVTLFKKTPHGAGLGGGSADAAQTFLALNELTGSAVPLETLAEWAGELGSDIPLFLYPSPCWCSGRGEIIQPLDLNWKSRILLFKPTFDIPTPWAYSRWQDSREVQGISYSPQTAGGQSLFNDLERPVFEKHRFLAELKQFLLDHPGTEAAMMSGSGSTVFAVLHDSTDAESLQKETLAKMDPTLWSHLAIF
ncbi:MAG: 4-diphosphocytidyl-2-C-methyl-D-erythritol kinase [Paracoccaceae bacterium]|jgi:4-diphosphocytidyl-2-C-methyl-D-erythritol kinase